MQKNIINSILLVSFLILVLHGFSQHQENLTKPEDQEAEKDLKNEIKNDIKHHVKDAYSFVFFSNSKTGESYGFSLPVILIDNGLHVFLSSKFNNGNKLVHIGDTYYKLSHSKIYKTDAKGTITLNAHGHPTNDKPIDLSITKNVLSIALVSLILFLIFSGLAKSYAKNGLIPKGIGRFFEPIVLYIRDEIAIPNIGEKHYKKYMNYLLTIFFFIWFSNLIGITPFGINITGNIAVTFALALLTFIITQFSGNKNYWKHIFWMPGVPVPMKIILAPIELLGVLIKPFALMIRLFANISAGHIVIYSLLGLIFIFKSYLGSSLSFGLALVISVLELLVAILQAYIFTMLSALYFGFATEEHAEAH
ncbi:MAG: ATP synthase F0 subunit A [Flavobacteriales bacterium CG_4_8_14_3_um_filter_35_10]|nr:MAG: ATP synthase F0 subunit A [Flavobacteriales bacterium CG_4_8_14_3_um_filter_35_10]